MSRSRTLVLLPGLLNDHTVWQGVIDRLDRTLDVRVMDLTRAASVPDMAEQVLAATADIPDPFTIAGFSMGGYVTLELLSRAAHRISGVLLQSTAERAESDGQRDMRVKNIARAETDFDGICKDIIANAVGPGHQADAVLKKTLADMFRRLGPEVFARQSTAVMNRADHTATLQALGANPTIRLGIACGDEDRVTPLKWSQRMAQACPSAGLQVISGAGHMAPCEEPAAVASLLGELMRD